MAAATLMRAGPVVCTTQSVQSYIDAASSPCVFPTNGQFSTFTFSSSGTATLPDPNLLTLSFDLPNAYFLLNGPIPLTQGQSLILSLGFNIALDPTMTFYISQIVLGSSASGDSASDIFNV